MSQSRFDSFSDALAARPGRFNIIERLRDAVTDLAVDLGVPIDYFAKRGGELDASTGVLRWQYSTVYEFPASHPNDPQGASDYDVGRVQFRTTLYTLTAPSDDVRGFLRDVTHRRLHKLFNTGPYDGYMSGFNFITDDKNESDPSVVGHGEVPATGLGVPNFSVEVYDEDGEMAGHAAGYSADFGVSDVEIEEGEAPGHEVWRIRSLNEPRNDYEVSPKPYSDARERAKNANGKTVYVNGLPAGSVTSRGTFWLSKEHTNPAQATYQSRKQIIDATSTPYQALSTGVKLYKVREDANNLYFSTVEPRSFDPAAADDISPTDTGLITEESVLEMDDDEPTTFVVTADVQDTWALGKYSTPAVREISHGQGFRMHLPGDMR